MKKRRLNAQTEKRFLSYLRAAIWVFLVLAVGAFVFKSCVPKKHLYPAAPETAVEPSAPPEKESPGKTAPSRIPKVAIILDDWGNNYSLLQKALDVQRPLTLAIIPRLSQSRRIAEEAHRNGLGVMIHMPMQPTDMGQPMEPHTIMTTTSDANIRRYVDEALRSVPHAAGMNNHMGSAATSNTRVMRTLLNYLKTKDLFFVDSAVIAGTVGQEVARQTRIRFAKRDVFIDNELNPSAIKRQLLKAKEIALRRGQVVVIGHDKKATLKAIQEMVPEFERDGVRFVLAEDLVGKVS